MKINKKFVVRTIVIVAILATFIWAVYAAAFRLGFFRIVTSGDWWIYRDVYQMSHLATDIVRGVILDERVERIGTLLPSRDGPDEFYLRYRSDFYKIHTINRIKVLEVFKGDAQVGEIMEIAQLGGRIGLSELVEQDRLQFTIGDDLVLFLRTFYASHGVHRPATLLTPFQSVYHAPFPAVGLAYRSSASIVEAFNTDPQIADIKLESFVPCSPNTCLWLTVGDLIQIRNENNPGGPSYQVAFHLYTHNPAILQRFGQHATANADGILVINVPITPGTPRANWPNQGLLEAALDIGHIFSTEGVPGHAFWGWFQDSTLTASGRALYGLRRPAISNTCQLDATLSKIEALAPGQTQTLFTNGTLDMFAVWSPWGDVNDDGVLCDRDLDLLRNYLLRLVGRDALNMRAADVYHNGVVCDRDLDLLRNYLLRLVPDWRLGMLP